MIPCPKCKNVTKVVYTLGNVRTRRCLTCKFTGMTQEVWVDIAALSKASAPVEPMRHTYADHVQACKAAGIGELPLAAWRREFRNGELPMPEEWRILAEARARSASADEGGFEDLRWQAHEWSEER